MRNMAVSREMDRREGILYRQGKGWFVLPGAGHEAIAACAASLRQDDYCYLYYRDRALMLELGATIRELALAFFGKADSSSGGRQMSNHFSSARLNVVSCGSPTGMQCLPAAGTAWACQMNGRGQIVLCTIGDAAVRQGEFYEALCFATERMLPIVFVVEDNGFGVSTRTAGRNPLDLGVLGSERLRTVNGRNPSEVGREFAMASDRARAGMGPTVIWADVDRIMSHTSSDDQTMYRSVEELEGVRLRDQMGRLRDDEIVREVEEEYQDAFQAENPSEPLSHVFSSLSTSAPQVSVPADKSWTIVQAINDTLRGLLAGDDKVVLFGQDIEDPKGGVFGMTKGLSTKYPARVTNAPLAEATIVGAAAGLAVAGYKPIFELQFIDFAGPAFNQMVNNVATLRWRSRGEWRCPMVIIAPSGAYLPGGGPWHSQSAEAFFAHAPGLRVVMPSTPKDAAALLATASAGDDPVLFLVPKHLSRKEDVSSCSTASLPLGSACTRRTGLDLTILAWGNCVDVAIDAAAVLGQREVSAEVIDLRSIIPCDWDAIEASIAKTGRLLVVQEDNRTCSVGQALVAEVVSNSSRWSLLGARPVLLSRPDVHVGFHPDLERAVLPDCQAVVDAAICLMAS